MSAFALTGLSPAHADAGEPHGISLLQISAQGEDTANIMIYGLIGDSIWDDTLSPRELVEQIRASTAATLNVYINSRGGVVADGMAIYNALKAHTARKVVWIDGQACSIASLIAMAGDEVVAYSTSLLMVHAPSAIAGGHAAVFRQHADALDTHAEAMLTAYVAKTDKADEIRTLLTDGIDHWYTAEQALSFGFVDRIESLDPQAEARAEAPRIVALDSYLAAIDGAPSTVRPRLRGLITAAASPQVFASLPEVTQQAVFGHIEDPMQKQRLLNVLAAAAGAPAAPAAPAAPVVAPVVAVQPDPMTVLQERNTQIVSLFDAHRTAPGMADLERAVLANTALTIEAVQGQMLAAVAQGRGPLGTVVVPGADEREKTRAAMINAIESRAGIVTADSQNPFRGHSLSELARECVVRAGLDTRGMDKMEIVGLSFTHSTSDFPVLLGDAARKSVLKGYEEVDSPIESFTSPVSVPDFKPTTLVGLGAFSNLLVVPENGEYKYGTFSEQSQSMQVVTYGRLFSISRQAIINDDLGIFSEVPRKMGRAARRTIVEAVWKLITSNPSLKDGKTLFHADHGNLLTGSAISTTSVDAMRVAMAKQKDADENIIRVPMKNLLTPLALGGLARTVRDSQTEVSGGKNLTTPNTVKGTFDVVDDGHLDDANAATWYGVADPSYIDAIVIAYLNGNKTPYLEQHEGFTVDGVAWKVRLDAQPGIADYRGIYKNPGS
jgi:ATP-dependent protease ClpP protease subunit